MRNETQVWSLALCCALLTPLIATSQASIVETDFVSIGDRQFIAGTTTDLIANEPGGVQGKRTLSSL